MELRCGTASVTVTTLDGFPIARATDPRTWLARCPALQVEGAPAAPAVLEPPEDCTQRLLREGYFVGAGLKWGEELPAMVEAVRGFVRDGIPPVFAFVYDQFWGPFARLQRVVYTALGGDYRALPAFWLWHVDPARSQRGWKAHRDRGYRSLMADRSPKSVTVWVPLTAATPENGCVYIVPADRDPLYGGPLDRVHKFDPSAPRPLAVAPGQFICWNQAVLHWGGEPVDRGAPPRVSMALEFQRSDQPAMDQPLLDPALNLTLEQRLRLIAKQIVGYEHMENSGQSWLPAARRIARGGS